MPRIRPDSTLDIVPAFFHSLFMAKPVLGRGLSALLGNSDPTGPINTPPVPVVPEEPQDGESVRRVPIDRVRPCPFQPRKDFTEESILELAESIKSQGIIQPLVVRLQGDYYELIAGERRWRAAKAAGLFETPVIVREADDRTVLEMALVENLQRENLNAIEEALGFADLVREFNLTQEAVATKVGKNRATVANAMRLLKLAPEIQSHIRHNRLSVGHAKVVLGLESHEQQTLAVDRVLRENLNVRQTEQLVNELTRGAGKGASNRGAKTGFVRDTHISDLESRLQQHLGTKVLLRYRKGKGAVEIRFFNDEDLERVLQILGIENGD